MVICQLCFSSRLLVYLTAASRMTKIWPKLTFRSFSHSRSSPPTSTTTSTSSTCSSTSSLMSTTPPAVSSLQASFCSSAYSVSVACRSSFLSAGGFLFQREKSTAEYSTSPGPACRLSTYPVHKQTSRSRQQSFETVKPKWFISSSFFLNKSIVLS